MMKTTPESSVPLAERSEMCEVRQVDPARVARGQELLLAANVYDDLAGTFRAMADPSRVKIIYSLLAQELCVCDLAAVVRVSESAVSQHLRVLRDLRLVRSRREGKAVYYSLDDGHIRTLLNVCLDHLRHRDRERGPDTEEANDGGR